MLTHLCDFDAAEPVLAQAVTCDPSRPAAWLNLGLCLLEQARYPEAIEALTRSLQLRPAHAGALSALGVALHRGGAHAQAAEILHLALRLDPHNHQTCLNRAVALLSAGDYPAGFADYEARLGVSLLAPLPGPRWDGAPFAGRTLLLHEEEGLGDVLQFARYAPLAKARGGRVILRVWPALASLLSRLPGPDLVCTTDDPLPGHDLVCPLLSLAGLFATTPDTIPAADGYLAADPAKAALWRNRLRADSARAGLPSPLRVGLVWAGGARAWHRAASLADRRRSLALSDLAPLAAASPSCLFYSLQIGEAGRQARQPPPTMRLVDHTPLIENFDDTAALASNLDLVVSVDTSTAHLAAALGRPVFLLSRYDRCWRWCAGTGGRTPWYSSMRLYRQARPLDWSVPIAQAARDLAHLVALAAPFPPREETADA